MLKYGSDKPDLRNPLFITDLSELFAGSSFRAFAGKTVRAMRLPKTSDRTRSFWDKLEEQAKGLGAAGLAWLTVEEGGTLKGPVAKFLTPESTGQLIAATSSETGDAVIIVADTDVDKICRILGTLRNSLGTQLGLIEENVYKFCWIVDFPMYEANPDTGKTEKFSHNPFCDASGPVSTRSTHRTRSPLRPFSTTSFATATNCRRARSATISRRSCIGRSKSRAMAGTK